MTQLTAPILLSCLLLLAVDIRLGAAQALLQRAAQLGSPGLGGALARNLIEGKVSGGIQEL